MTRQEVAISRSHIEVWKSISIGTDDRVLVLEDDVWFKNGAAAAITRGWSAALGRCVPGEGPHLLYLSYEDADGTAERADICEDLFRPLRGLWFLSGYVLSREGAARLLKAMPIVGPVDTWINYRFAELSAFALSSPAILQRPDITSQNSYSVLPYLARAGIVDAGAVLLPAARAHRVKVLAWTGRHEHESLPMALSMLGLRVKVFDDESQSIGCGTLEGLFETFEALVNPPLAEDEDVLVALAQRPDLKLVMEGSSRRASSVEVHAPPKRRIAILPEGPGDWGPLCALLNVPEPPELYPLGADGSARLFRDTCSTGRSHVLSGMPAKAIDESPWVVPRHLWQSSTRAPSSAPPYRSGIGRDSAAVAVVPLGETFPGNLAEFCPEGLRQDGGTTRLTLSETATATRSYRSGAFASVHSLKYGHFEAEIKAARGPGLITGFFLHRSSPRQEIDVELTGGDPRRMLANVFFNPGDEGSALEFGYRGTPFHIDLGFDAAEAFHLYAIDWNPDRIIWSVDGRTVHERGSWNPTPIPHLPMRLHGNLWAPRSVQLAGNLNDADLPSSAEFGRVSFYPAAGDSQEHDVPAQTVTSGSMVPEATPMADAQ